MDYTAIGTVTISRRGLVLKPRTGRSCHLFLMGTATPAPSRALKAIGPRKEPDPIGYLKVKENRVDG
jgi:hypothetical protein